MANMPTKASYDDLLRQNGFEIVLQIPIQSKIGYSGDVFEIHWNDAGILLRLDTFGGYLNSTEAYFNSISDPAYPAHGYWGDVSGTRVFVGHINCDSNFSANINTVIGKGLLKPWLIQPMMWLVCYADKCSFEEVSVVNSERLAMLPEHIRRAVKA